MRPVFSLVIPTYRRPEHLAKSLDAIGRLDYPRSRFEVIVVDDGSDLPLEAIVAPFRDRMEVTLLRRENGGPAAARNAGAALARGEVLVFTDDDCAPAPDWLRALEARLATTPDCAVGGRTINALPDNAYSTASQLLLDYLYAYYNHTPGCAQFIASNNFAVPARHFRMVGGFDTTFPLAAAEDREFCDRWLHYGHRIVYAPDVVVHHAHPMTFRSFWRQQFNYGRGAARFHMLRQRRREECLRIEPPGFYIGILRLPFGRVKAWQVPFMFALMVVSQVAIVAGIFSERARLRR